ncbi:DUF6440 family protein [Deinococcus marmoris]|uniref:DUF6440 family protein n=1 Tax=Deinococcus marmoris TaxID=249408 RepID=UPI0004983291|nr:DUF6440 family protein [Deinococcus marmoris]
MAKKKRFKVVYEENGWSESIRILCDQETGVCYLTQFVGFGSSVTALLDQDGKPVRMPRQAQT